MYIESLKKNESKKDACNAKLLDSIQYHNTHGQNTLKKQQINAKKKKPKKKPDTCMCMSI